MTDWQKFIITFLLVLAAFGISYDLFSRVSCTAMHNANIIAVLIGCSIQYTIVYLLPFVVGLVISLLKSIGEKAENKKSVAQRFLRGVHISIPIAIFLVFINAYSTMRLSG